MSEPTATADVFPWMSVVRRAFDPVRYQIDSYNRCIDKVETMLVGVNPIRIFHEYDETRGKYCTAVSYTHLTLPTSDLV